MNKVKVLFTAFLLNTVGCGGEYSETGTRATTSSTSPFVFKNATSSTCIESNPMGLAACNNSATQKIEMVRMGRRAWLRFVGTDQCLYANSEKQVLKKKCKTNKNKYFWYPKPTSNVTSSGEGTYVFVSSFKRRCLKVNSSGTTLKAGGCDDGSQHKWKLSLSTCADPDAGDDDIYQATTIGSQADQCVDSSWFEGDGMSSVKEVQCDGTNVVSTVKQCMRGGTGPLTSCYQGACLRPTRVENPTVGDFELVKMVHEPEHDATCLKYASISEEKKGDEVIQRTEMRNWGGAACGNIVAIARVQIKAAFASGTIDTSKMRAYIENKYGWVLYQDTCLSTTTDSSGGTVTSWFSADAHYLYYVTYYDHDGGDDRDLLGYLNRHPPLNCALPGKPCTVKVNGVVVKSVQAADRNDCYKQTSFGSANCSTYADYFHPGSNLLEQFFNGTDRVNSDTCAISGSDCLIRIEGVCTNYPSYSNFNGTDTWGMANRNAGTDEAACKQRATDFYNWCGNENICAVTTFTNTGNSYSACKTP